MVGAAAASGLAQNKWTPIVVGVVILGMGVLTYFGVVRPILQAAGIMGDKESRTEDKTVKEGESLNGWKPQYWKDRKNKLTISESDAAGFAKTIYNSDTYWDDEEAVYGVLRRLKNNTDLSLVSSSFFEQYNKDLLEYMKDFLNEGEMIKVYNIANKLS